MLYFDDIEQSQRWRVGEYSLSRDEVVAFASRWDPQPFHIDEEAARASIFGGLTASSLHLFAICTRLFFDMDEKFALLAMLGKDRVRFPRPARVGDTLTYWTQAVECLASQSKPDRGIVTLADSLLNSAGEEVMTQQVTLMVSRRPA